MGETVVKKRIAIVCQRYGLEVNGGAETLTRVWAEKLSAYYHVEVLTTCAVEYSTWANEYPAGMDYLKGIPVRRFPVDHERQVSSQRTYEAILFRQPRTEFCPLDEAEFMLAQGPASTSLLRFIEGQSSYYDAFIFVTYLYFSTVVALPLVAEKALLIPTAHDEVPFFMDCIRSLMHLPRFIFYNTVEEQTFAHKVCGNAYIPSAVVGMGVEVLADHLLPDFAAATDISAPYVLYAGRIDEAKGCRQLFEFWEKFKRSHPEHAELKLVMIGKAFIDIPHRADIVALGFVSEEIKYAAMRSAQLLILPSSQESLSIVVLESLLYRRPVLVNGQCDVLLGHVERGNAGFYYLDYDQFDRNLHLLLTDKNLRDTKGADGYRYVCQNYQWDRLLTTMTSSIDRVCGQYASEGRDTL